MSIVSNYRKDITRRKRITIVIVVVKVGRTDFNGKHFREARPFVYSVAMRRVAENGIIYLPVA